MAASRDEKIISICCARVLLGEKHGLNECEKLTNVFRSILNLFGFNQLQMSICALFFIKELLVSQ